MKYPDTIDVAAIVAVRDEGKRLRSCLLAIRDWVPEIWVVLPRSAPAAEAVAEELGVSTMFHDSGEAEGLWEAGMRRAGNSWRLLLHSNEVITGRLKTAIWEKVCASPPNDPCMFPLPRTTVFLKKRFKYPVKWTDSPASCLAFSGKSSGVPALESLRRIEVPFQRELIHYGEETLADVLETVRALSDLRADRLCERYPDLSKARLAGKTLRACFRNGARIYFADRGFKEGFEGMVFAAAEVAAALLGHFRYYEKYVRSGYRIHKNLGTVRNVLVIKLREIGDAVLSTPVFRSVKHALPHATLSVLTFGKVRAVLEGNPHIDRFFELPKKPGNRELRDLIRVLNSRQFDLAIDLSAGKLSTSLLKKIRAQYKINNFYIGRNKGGDALVEESDYYRSAVERDLDSLRAIGIQPAGAKTELFVTGEEVERARKYLSELGFDLEKKVVIVHLTASRQTKEWGLDRFGRLIHQLTREKDIQVMATCSPDEYPRVKALSRSAPETPIFTGPVRPLMALIHEADLLVGNDSGPSHIAAAFDTPTVVLFGPEIKAIFRNGYSENGLHTVFYKDVPCRECGLSECGHHICLDFTVEEVHAQCIKSLAHSDEERRRTPGPGAPKGDGRSGKTSCSNVP
ncbi:MAG: glycosyltransferase family 9 protein [Nitrospinales bacterium]